MRSLNKIVFFIEAHFNKRDYDRFGIETLIQNGFEVEVWDFTPFLTLGAYQKTKPPDPIDWGKIFSFKSKKKALSAISNLSQSCFVIPNIHYNLKTFSIFRMLSKKNIPFSSMVQSTVLPVSTAKETSNKKLETLRKLIKLNWWIDLQRIDINSLFEQMFAMIPFNYLQIKPANIVFAPAEKYIMPNFPINKKSEILRLHSLDYDNYLSERDNDKSVDIKMGVFLDQFHGIDMIYQGRQPAINPEEYYPAICNCFDFIEKKYGVRIVIAAHPRSRYERKPDIFDGRTVIRGKTAELVKKANFVLLHNSSAINYAVLFKKPIILLTTNRINQNFTEGIAEDPSLEWLASFFGKKLHNLDTEIRIDMEEELYVNEKAYMAYKNSYIKKHGSEELPFWQIVANRIKNLR